MATVDVLLLVVVMSFLPSEISNAMIKTSTTFRRAPHDNLLFTTNIIFQAFTDSKLACSRVCSELNSCSAFTFVTNLNPGSLMSGLCRGHSELTNVQLATQEIGARTFTMARRSGVSAWLGKACGSVSDCPSSFPTTCHQGQCLCRPEQYYSNGTDSCVATCQQGDVGTTFIKYAGMDTVNNNIYIDNYDQPNLEICQSDCVNHVECRTISFGIGTSYNSCWLIRDFAASDISIPEPWSVYKRNCA